MRHRLGLTAFASIALTIGLIAPAIGAGSGGRVLLTSPVRLKDTRSGPPVTTVVLGSGVLMVWVSAPESAGTATIHACNLAPPPDQVTFRLDPAMDVQYARFATAESSCLTSTTPLHVTVDSSGTVAATPDGTRSQYVPLQQSVELFDAEPATDSEVIRITRPPSLSQSATAAVLSVEVLVSDQPGHVRVYGCSGPPSPAADVAYNRNRAANVAYVELGPTEDICLSLYRPSHIRVRLLGELATEGPNPNLLPPSWRYTPGDVPAPSFRPIPPVRVLDTRKGLGRAGTTRVPANEIFELDLGRHVGPYTTAVALNVTVTQPQQIGHLTVWPCGDNPPLVSNLNFVASETVPNLVVSKLGPGGTICMSGVSATHLVADLNGTYEIDGGLAAVPVEPARILDTRYAIGVPTTTKLTGRNFLELQISGDHDVPPTAGAVTLNLTSTQPDEAGFLTVYPCGTEPPDASNVNYVANQTVPNLVTAKLSNDGKVCIYTSATTHVIADIAAWYGVDEPAGLIDLNPSRILDTRLPLGVPAAAKVEPKEFIVLKVAGRNGVASDADAVVMNVTVTEPEAEGFVTVWPCDQTIPTVSNLNYTAGETNPNLVTVKLAADGTVCLYTVARAHLLADVAGYLTDQPVDGQQLTLG